jgi:hypothetical protein
MFFSLIPDLGGELSNAVVVCRCATRCWKGAVVCFARGVSFFCRPFSAVFLLRRARSNSASVRVLSVGAGAHCVRLCFPKRSSHENEMARGSSHHTDRQPAWVADACYIVMAVWFFTHQDKKPYGATTAIDIRTITKRRTAGSVTLNEKCTCRFGQCCRDESARGLPRRADAAAGVPRRAAGDEAAVEGRSNADRQYPPDDFSLRVSELLFESNVSNVRVK